MHSTVRFISLARIADMSLILVGGGSRGGVCCQVPADYGSLRAVHAQILKGMPSNFLVLIFV